MGSKMAADLKSEERCFYCMKPSTWLCVKVSLLTGIQNRFMCDTCFKENWVRKEMR